MHYQITPDGGGFKVRVISGGKTIAETTAKDMDEAVRLRDAANRDGPDALKAKPPKPAEPRVPAPSPQNLPAGHGRRVKAHK